MAKYKDDILRLARNGHSYREIAKELGCSLSTVSYHLGKGQKEKTRRRSQEWFERNPLARKVDRFKKNVDWKKARTKLRDYKRPHNGSAVSPGNDLGYRDVLEKYGESPVCYLTGLSIDIHDLHSYSLDHIVPRSLGGESTIENMGITLREINLMKSDIPLERFIELCKLVAAYN